MKVIKFGGTSQCLIGYNKIIEIIKQSFSKDISNDSKNDQNDQDNDSNTHTGKIVIVLSAVSGVTNLLEKFLETKEMKYIEQVIDKNQLLIDELNKYHHMMIRIDSVISTLKEYIEEYASTNSDNVHIKAKIIGYGEVISTNILYQLVKDISDKIILCNAYSIIKSRKETSKLYPSIEFYCSDNIHKYLEDNQVIITQGFIASTPSNKTIILGRGGSDTTGALIASAINSTEYQVWTDVDGIYTADPRLVKEAQLMKEVKYEIVQEMAGMGAKVMHPYSIAPCQEKGIPIKLFNTFSYNTENTIISNSNNTVFCVTSQKNVTLFKITSLSMWNNYGFVYDIFKSFSDKKIDVNIITTSQFSISTTTNEKDYNILKELYDDLSEKYQVDMIHNNSIVSLVSNNLIEYEKNVKLNRNHYELIHHSPNDLTINYVVNSEIMEDIINDIHSSILI
jgi:aspartate kinase